MDSQQPPPPAPDNSTKGRRERRMYEAAQKRRRALELRMAGNIYEDIAQAVGYKSRSAAKNAIKSALRAIDREPAADVKALELERLDKILTALWGLVGKGDVQAIDRVIRVMHQRAQYLGLYAPKQVEHSGPDGGPIQFAQMGDAELDAWLLAQAEKVGLTPDERKLLANFFAKLGVGRVAVSPGGEGAAGGDADPAA